MLQKVGWKKDFVLKSTPVLPISGWVGDNLLKKSTNMAWWSGCYIEVEAKGGTEKLHIDCLYDCLNNMARPPVRPADSAMRLPVSGIYKIKGLDKQNMPRSGDVMVYKKDTSLGACDNFDAQ